MPRKKNYVDGTSRRCRECVVHHYTKVMQVREFCARVVPRDDVICREHVHFLANFTEMVAKHLEEGECPKKIYISFKIHPWSVGAALLCKGLEFGF